MLLKNPFLLKLLWKSVIPWHPPGMPTFIIISVTNGWWLQKTRQKRENRTLRWMICLVLKRWWLSKDGMDKHNSCQFFSVQIFNYKQQNSFLVVIFFKKAEYSRHHCLVNKIHEDIIDGLISPLARLHLINFWMFLGLSKGVDIQILLRLLFKMWW